MCNLIHCMWQIFKRCRCESNKINLRFWLCTSPQAVKIRGKIWRKEKIESNDSHKMFQIGRLWIWSRHSLLVHGLGVILSKLKSSFLLFKISLEHILFKSLKINCTSDFTISKLLPNIQFIEMTNLVELKFTYATYVQ